MYVYSTSNLESIVTIILVDIITPVVDVHVYVIITLTVTILA